jgi:hypothetical protein
VRAQCNPFSGDLCCRIEHADFGLWRAEPVPPGRAPAGDGDLRDLLAVRTYLGSLTGR